MQQMEKYYEQSPAVKQEKTTLRQTMGLRETVTLGVGGTIGGAIFILVGRAIQQAGLGALLSFGLAFLAAVVIALPYAELACRYPFAGGGYAFVQAVLGRHWGFLMGWVYAGSWLFISGYITIGFGQYIHSLFVSIPPIVGAFSLIIGIVGINLTGGRLFGRVQNLVVLLAVSALVGYSAFGLPYAYTHISHFSLFLPNGIRGILEVTPLAFLALAGFDVVAAAGEEIKRPQRTLPLAILLTLGIVLLLYLLVTIVTAGVLPQSELGTFSPLADAAHLFLGPIGERLIAVVAVLTTAATANAILVATSRVTFAMARDGLLPRFFARVRSSTKVPWSAVLANGVILALIALAGVVLVDPADLAAAGSFLYVLQFLFPLVVLVILRRRSSRIPSFRTPAPYLVLPLAFGGCLLLLYVSKQVGKGIGLGWLMVGLLSYVSVQCLLIHSRKRFYLKKGYAATMEVITALKGQINRELNTPEAPLEQVLGMQAHIGELKQLRAMQARMEEYEQLRAAHTRIEELKQLRIAQARIEELELLRAVQLCIEELELLRAAQASDEELKLLQTIQLQATTKKLRKAVVSNLNHHANYRV